MNTTSVRGGRIPSLDGLRAVAICLVLLLHMSGAKNFLPYRAIEPFNPGALGVIVFFVISGFLITSLLLKEIANTGKISLKQFYWRRVLRIFPAFYLYISVIALLAATGVITLLRWDLIRAVTFSGNYGRHAWWVGHIWSLSVEEQFYLLWPACMCFLGRARSMKVAFTTVLAVPLIRFAIWVWIPSYREEIGYSFETCADSLATGCLLAGMRDWMGRQARYLQFLKSPWFLLVPVGVIAGSMSFARPRIECLIGHPMENICIALLIDRVVRVPGDFVGRILNCRPFVFIGALSYSLYLWQQPFCRRVEVQNWTTAFPANLLLSLTCALACHYCIEKPVLRLKKRQTTDRETRATTAAAL